MAIDPDCLLGRWTHSHEEDEPGTLVFRPDGWTLPPSRGRRSFELLDDGVLKSGRPGPDDRSVGRTGRWRLLPGDILELEEPGGPLRRHVLEAGKDRLILER